MSSRWSRNGVRTPPSYTTILNMGDRVKMITEADVLELLEGAVDIHVHAAPDPEIDVGWDQIEVSKKATDLGMGAVVFKAHTIPTAATVYFVQQAVDGIAAAIGKKSGESLWRRHPELLSGGLNPEACRCVRISAERSSGCPATAPHPSPGHGHEKAASNCLTKMTKPVPELCEIFQNHR